MEDLSGCDMDLYGDPQAGPAVAVPQPGESGPCVLKVDGECPEACNACVEFAEEMQVLATEGTEDTEKSDEIG